LSESHYKIEFYVPASHVEATKEALFSAGAGSIGDYDSCAWQTLGAGQFRPGDNSNPYLGNKNQLETVQEYKVELVCKNNCLEKAIAALKESHPYEEPAYSVIKLEQV
jgi:hypothetical protein